MRKKLTPLVEAMNIFSQLDERDRQTLADWIRSQTATPRKKSTKKKVDMSGTEATIPTGTWSVEGTKVA